MIKKIIFLDLDGTLVASKDTKNYIPDSAKLAIELARSNGHLVYYCTGRSECDIDECLNDLVVDGKIGGSGSYIISGNRMIFEKHMNVELVKKVEELFRKNDIHYWLETNDGYYLRDEKTREILKDLVNKGIMSQTFYELQNDYDPKCLNFVNKIIYHSKTFSLDEINELLNSEFEIVPISYWKNDWKLEGEITPRDTNKGVAINYLLDYLKIDKKDSIGIGDSYNDLAMFENVGCSVAMGNGDEEVKKLATIVTSNINENGLYNAFKLLGLI